MQNMSQKVFFFFFYATATPETYTLSLHDALPILLHFCFGPRLRRPVNPFADGTDVGSEPPTKKYRSSRQPASDRKSTRLNSSHVEISYAVFCLKKKKTTSRQHTKDQ